MCSKIKQLRFLLESEQLRCIRPLLNTNSTNTSDQHCFEFEETKALVEKLKQKLINNDMDNAKIIRHFQLVLILFILTALTLTFITIFYIILRCKRCQKNKSSQSFSSPNNSKQHSSCESSSDLYIQPIGG